MEPEALYEKKIIMDYYLQHQTDTFDLKNYLGQMTLFEVLRKCHLVTLSKMCLWLRPCAYLYG